MCGRIFAALVFGIASFGAITVALAEADPVDDPGVARIRDSFKVDGIALFDPHATHAPRMGVCAPSIFPGLKWCVSGTAEEKKGDAAYVKTTGYNIESDGRIVYAISSRRSYPLKRDEFDGVIQAIGERYGAGAALYAFKKPGEEGAEVNSLIAVWGGLRLVHLTEGEYATVESGGSLKRGHLVDHRFNLVASAKQRNPIYKIEGEAGFILHLMVTSPDRADVIMRVVYAPAFATPGAKPSADSTNPLVTETVRRANPAPRTRSEIDTRRVDAERGLAAERLLREEAERKAAEEKSARAEAERKFAAERKAFDEEKKRLEAERKAAEERAKRAEEEFKVNEERRRKEESERAARAEAERKAAEERARRAERERMSSEERRRAEEVDRKAAEEAARRADVKRAEAERKAVEERRRKEEADRKAAEERAKRAEAERKALEERRRKEEAERKAADAKRAEDERKAAEERRAEPERKAAEERRAAAQTRADDEAARKAAEEKARRAGTERAAEEGRKDAEQRASAERQAEAERLSRERTRPEEWYRRAADAAKAAGAIWSLSETQDRVTEERTLRTQTIFGGAGQEAAGQLAVEVTFECTIIAGERRLRAVARGFDRKSGTSVAFKTEAEGTFGVRTRFRLDDQPAQDGLLFRERQDDMASILEMPMNSSDLGTKIPRAAIWLRHYAAAIEFNLVTGNVAATIAPYAENLRKVLEACAE